jgi:hypothetical protein
MKFIPTFFYEVGQMPTSDEAAKVLEGRDEVSIETEHYFGEDAWAEHQFNNGQ